MPEFEPEVVGLIQRGATAAMLLDAQKHLSNACVDEVLKKIDTAAQNGTLHELAVGFCHEIAAFRRIVHRQQSEIARGKAWERSLAQKEAANG